LIDEKIRELERVSQSRIDREVERTSDVLREVSKIEDINEGIKYLIASAKTFDCVICRALHIHMIEYLLRYERIKREREGKPTEDIERLMKELPEKLKRELLVSEEQYERAGDKFIRMLGETYSEFGG